MLLTITGSPSTGSRGLGAALDDDALRVVISKLPAARDLAAVACTSRRLGLLAGEDAFWRALLLARLPRVAALLDAAPASAQPEWWAGRTWRQRVRALAGGASFQAQVFNRELENEAEDFLLSTYDATVRLTPASARALVSGCSPQHQQQPSSCGEPSGKPLTNAAGDSVRDAAGEGAGSGGAVVAAAAGSGAAGTGAAGTAGAAAAAAVAAPTADQPQQRAAGAGGELLFLARYLPMGSMPAVEEAEVSAARLRLPPPGSSPFAVFGGSGGAAPSASAGLVVGEEVEVQWKGRRSHPFGWWFGTVQSVRGNRIALLFRQYPRSSVWHRVRAPIKPGREAVVNGDCSFGYVGGLRRLSAEEREEWRRHGAPHPPAAAALQALVEEAGEEDWSDDELDLDVELAAELEDELDELPAGGQPGDPPAGHPGGPAGAAAAGLAPAGFAVGGGGQPAAAAALEEAVAAPAGPPGEPIAMQLGQAAAVAAAAGLPVELAGGPAGAAGQVAEAGTAGGAQL